MAAVCAAYERKYERPLATALRREISGDCLHAATTSSIHRTPSQYRLRSRRAIHDKGVNTSSRKAAYRSAHPELLGYPSAKPSWTE